MLFSLYKISLNIHLNNTYKEFLCHNILYSAFLHQPWKRLSPLNLYNTAGSMPTKKRIQSQAKD